ncbi:Nonstructural protein [Kuriyama virus]|nr:Nonstructural protein [Kuriyama virus]
MSSERALYFTTLNWRCSIQRKKKYGMGRIHISAVHDASTSYCESENFFMYNILPNYGFSLRVNQKTVVGCSRTVYDFLDQGVLPARVCAWDGSGSCVAPIKNLLDCGISWQFCNWTIENLVNNGEVEVLRALSWPTGKPTLQFIREFCRSKSFDPYNHRKIKSRVARLIFKAAQSGDGEGLGEAIVKCWKKVRSEAMRLGVPELEVPGADIIRDISLIQIERAFMRIHKCMTKWDNLPATGWDEPGASMFIGVTPFYNLSQKLSMRCKSKIRNEPGSRVWMRRRLKEKEDENELELNDPQEGILNVWMLDIRDHFQMFPDLVHKVLDKSFGKDWPALGAP